MKVTSFRLGKSSNSTGRIDGWSVEKVCMVGGIWILACAPSRAFFRARKYALKSDDSSRCAWAGEKRCSSTSIPNFYSVLLANK